MEVRTADMVQLRREMKKSVEFVERLQQFHLSTKPMFFHRDSWNTTNDMLHDIKMTQKDNLNLLDMALRDLNHGIAQPRR
jgi:hypothetical protein